MIDNMISFKIKKCLKAGGVEAEHVVRIGLHENTDDPIIWNYCNHKGYTILTKDHDFLDLLNQFGPPPKLIMLLCGNKTTYEICEILSNHFESIKKFLNQQEFGILEIT